MIDAKQLMGSTRFSKLNRRWLGRNRRLRAGSYCSQSFVVAGPFWDAPIDRDSASLATRAGLVGRGLGGGQRC
eukprot:3089480-Amphidinium_carterae.1